ncbi:hypothetical protein [Miniimonas arenae]|uniref:hypothetical protein n=1 Tax=Miniimonas arenae TaxID=676201 RepID=UPI0028A8F72C|nr:hypothetical protein [Miniimonas arenae]
MTKVYKAPLLPRLILLVVLAFFIVLTCVNALPQELPRSLGGLNQRRLISLLIALVPVALVAWWTLVWQNRSLAVTPTAVEVRRGSKVTQQFDRATTRFGSHVTQQRSYGMKTGAVRSLVAMPQGASKPVQVTVPGLSKNDFNELYASLVPLDVPSSQPGAGGQGFPQGGAPGFAQGFGSQAPAAPWAAPGSTPQGQPQQSGALSWSPGGAPQSQSQSQSQAQPQSPAAPWAAPGATPQQQPGGQPAYPQPGAGQPAGAAPSSFAPRRDWAGGSGRKVPERIDVSAGLLVVDGEQLPFASLRSIQLTPRRTTAAR